MAVRLEGEELMRLPYSALSGHLVWGRDGSVWAVWRVAGSPYRYLGGHHKLEAHSRIRAALRALSAESLLLGLCRRVDPFEVVEAMIAGVDLDSHPAWRDLAIRTLDSLAEVESFERIHFLAARLCDEGTEGRWGRARAALGAVNLSFGMPSLAPGEDERDRRRRQADHLEEQLAPVLAGLARATPKEIEWVYRRAVLRGVEEPFLEPADGAEPTNGELVMGRCPWGQPIFKEGGFASDPNRPRHRRYLSIVPGEGDAISYQAFAVLAAIPDPFYFPGGLGEWFVQPANLAFPVDWAARVSPVANPDAQRKSRRQARELASQVGEYRNEPSGPPQSLADALAAVDDERAELARNPADPELEATIVFCVFADSLAELETRASRLRNLYEANEYDMPRPTGGQLGLFSAMLPGAPLPPVARDYTQYLLPRDLAAGMPFSASTVGDPTGLLLGMDESEGTLRPVLFDSSLGPAADLSGSLAVVGDLGSGKSFALKAMAWSTVARGGQAIVLDRTQFGEYARLAEVIPGRAQTIDLTPGSSLCLDPLRMFSSPDKRRQHATAFLSLVARIDPSSIQGAALDEAVHRVAAAPDGTLADVVDVLEGAASTDRDSDELARLLRRVARSPLGVLAFGRGPALTLDADYVVFHIAEMLLPSKEELTHEHLYRQLLPQQVTAQALLYLVAAVAREVIFSDLGRFGVFVADEAWALNNPQGQGLLAETLKDGRKHNAALWLASQDPADFGAEGLLTRLIRNRFVFRCSEGAADALSFLGCEPSADLVEEVQTLERGSCLYRDVRDRIGRVQVLAPLAPDLTEAFDTNPLRANAEPSAAAAEKRRRAG